MVLARAERVRLHRERGKAKISVATCFVAILSLVGSGIAWLTILQAKSFIDVIESSPSTQARNLLEVSSTETSVVECTIRKPNNLMDPSSNGVFQITVYHNLSPAASKTFMDLVKEEHFDGNFLFRVLDGFLAQWGIRHREIERKVGKKFSDLKQKDPVTPQSLSNTRGTLSFNDAGGRNKQVFVNLKDNVHLDKQDRPFATLDEAGMKLMDNLYREYKDGQGQVVALQQGLDAIHKQFPNWSQIEKCKVVSEFGEMAARY